MPPLGYPAFARLPRCAWAELLSAHAGLAPGDIDVVQIYDHFSPFVIFALESNGFVKAGDGGAFVESGGMSWDGGEVPTNTSGGHLSEVYLQGMNT